MSAPFWPPPVWNGPFAEYQHSEEGLPGEEYHPNTSPYPKHRWRRKRVGITTLRVRRMCWPLFPSSIPRLRRIYQPIRSHAELHRCLAACLTMRFSSERPHVRPLLSRGVRPGNAKALATAFPVPARVPRGAGTHEQGLLIGCHDLAGTLTSTFSRRTLNM